MPAPENGSALDRAVELYDQIIGTHDSVLQPAAFGVAVHQLQEDLHITLHCAALLIEEAIEARAGH